MVAFSIFAAIYMVFELAILGPAQRKHSQLAADAERQKKQFESLKAEEVVLTKVLTTDPALKLKKEYEQLSLQLESLDKEIIDLSAGLVSAGQLAAMLQEVLVLTDGLALEGLTTEPPLSIPLPSDGVKSQDKQAKPTTTPAAQLRIYKQYIALKLKGNYFQILNYLKRLEATRWHFYWEALFYQVSQHPEATVEIRVYSLSIERPDHE
ncbi:MAG TPA: hypothetical protein PK011_17420 [Marinagarivorans sp.]|nr:hypothetical protein [Marinagarivorans sp.]